ncbi:MAG TPA: class F sortase [Candidatus Saccharimonadales bacterium]|nr:class F sortase [Candidatus Saccharimonadales bacterium]
MNLDGITKVSAQNSNSGRPAPLTGTQVPQPEIEEKPKKSGHRLRFAINLIASFTLLAGLYGGFTSWHNGTISTPKPSDTSQSDSSLSEIKPSFDNYTVAPDLPRFIDIKKIGVKARVKRLGVDSKNQLQAPSNVYDTGWYDGSAKPGEPGAVVIDGHRQGSSVPGIFNGLTSLATGDTIQIERGDNKVFTYQVVSIKQYAYNNVDMAAALTPVKLGQKGLNLITCSGTFKSKIGQYDKRTVVFTVQTGT